MQKDINENISFHPSSKELANFIDGMLNERRKVELTKHLIACDECSDAVALVIKYDEVEKKIALKRDNKYKTVNHVFYKGLGMVLVASVVLFMVMSTENNESFIEFFINNQGTSFKAPVTLEIQDVQRANQEINDFLKEITESTDMSHLKEFNQAHEKLKREEFDDARELYQKALNRVEDLELDKKKKERESIVITYKILLLSLLEGDDESANEYKEVLKEMVHHFRKRWLKDEIK